MYPEKFVPEMLKTRFLMCQSECKLGLDHVTSTRRVLQLQGYGQVLISQFISEFSMFVYVVTFKIDICFDFIISDNCTCSKC